MSDGSVSGFTARAVLAVTLLLSSGCSPGAEPGPPAPPESGATTLYQRLGEEAGIRRIVDDLVVRVRADPKINGYFLNAGVDTGRFSACLVKQIGSAVGGPQIYDCRDMKSAHAGMKISQADFDDLVGHLVAALKGADVSSADLDVITAFVAPLQADVVEDPGSAGSVYQRIGRKPAVVALVDGVVADIAADVRINGFFGAPVDMARFESCLVRQLCEAAGGPCAYGKEVDAAPGEPGVSASRPCRGMLAAHQGVTSSSGAGISRADFDAVLEHFGKRFASEPFRSSIPADDAGALTNAITGMCRDVVAGGAGCP